MKKAMFACLALCLAPALAQAAGMLVPTDQSLPPLAIKYQRVEVDIKDQVAVTKMEQVFQNNVNRVLEATYIFPVPAEAAITDFAMYIKGKRVTAELLEKGKARKIYEDIVRRMRDPGLLEYMDRNLFKLRVYPIPAGGTQKLEIEYSQVLRRDAGMHCYTYPLKTPGQAARTLEDFTVTARITSKEAIKNVYSPTHQDLMGISRKGDHEVVIGFEKNRAVLDKDFVLYYTVSEKEFGLNLLTQRSKDQDGYFMLMITPQAEFEEAEILPRKVCFVMDTSGSMSGEKVKQAKGALRHCVGNLKAKDSFNIVRFSTDVETFAEALVPANQANLEKARAFIDRMAARGGTDINGALLQGLRVVKTEAGGDETSPHMIVFLTDGLPTVGERDIDKIIANVSGANKRKSRIFVFGVGHDVNTRLLDRIAEDNRGIREYVAPNENIEVKVSLFFNKLSKPVLSDISLAVDKVKIKDHYPRELPDLFAGTQVSLFGRFEGSGHVAITLSGTSQAKGKEYVYEASFPKEESSHPFVERLWATRKVGYLLDEIRLHGENKELKEEVICLSKAFGIATPYTSYLIVEDQDRSRLGLARQPGETRAALRDAPIGFRYGGRGVGAADRGGARAARVPAPSVEALRERREAESILGSGERAGADWYLKPDAGKEAVALSRGIDELRKGIADKPKALSIRKVEGKTFEYVLGFWVDKEFKKDTETIEVKYLSDAYFELIKREPKLQKVFALGENLVVVLGKKAIVIQAEGKEKLSEEEFKQLLKK